MSNSVFVEFRLMPSVASNRCPLRTFLSLGNRKKSHGAKLVSMAAAANEQCHVWPKTAAQDVKCVRANCRGAGSSHHSAIFPVQIASHEPTESHKSSAISHTASLLLLRTIVLSLAIISSFLDVDGRPDRVSLSAEVRPSLNRRNQSNTCVRPIASSPHACCNN
jgi:hypothetical protein